MHTSESLSLRDIELLFRPFRHRKLDLPTRIIMAPMTRSFAMDGVPTRDMAQYYRRRAEQGLGMIITEGTLIDDPAASGDPDTPNFFGGAALRAWKAICTAVHATDCKIAPQLWHMGMARPISAMVPRPTELPIGPSGIHPVTLQQLVSPMSRSRIASVIDSFARGAANARSLGFDAVEIQGAHGYLIDQFLWSATNKRTDEYGGDIIGRTRFACEVIHAVRKAVGRDFPILFRFSQWKIDHYDARLAETPAELDALLQPLSEAGVDIFDCSTRTFSRAEFAGSPLSLAGWVRKLTGKPVIAVGSVGLQQEFTPRGLFNPVPIPAAGVTRLLQMIGSGEIDLIAVGRALLADPAWATKQHLGLEKSIIPYTKKALSHLR